MKAEAAVPLGAPLSEYYCMGGNMLNLSKENTGKTRMPLAGLPGYFRVVDGETKGTSLLKAFSAQNKRLLSLLGFPEKMKESRRMHPDGKYTSDFFLERGIMSGEFYSIYRCYGEWRVGGLLDFCPHLGELLELIDPNAHFGWSKLRPERIFESGLHAGVLSTDKDVERHWGRFFMRFEPPVPARNDDPNASTCSFVDSESDLEVPF